MLQNHSHLMSLASLSECLYQAERVELIMVVSFFLLSSDLYCCVSHAPCTSLKPHGTFPRHSAWQVPEGTETCSDGMQGCSFASCFAQPLHTPDMRAIPAFLQSPDKIMGLQACADFEVVLLVFWLRLLSYMRLGSGWKGKSVSQ